MLRLLPVGPAAVRWSLRSSSVPAAAWAACSKPTVVAATAVTAVRFVLLYVSRLAMLPITSPVRVSKTSTAASEYDTTKVSPDGLSGEMAVGLAVEPSDRGMDQMSVLWQGVLEPRLGCGVAGNALPLLIELPRTRLLPPPPPAAPETPARPDTEPGCGDASCGGALTAQIFTVPSADPDASKMCSAGPNALLGPKRDPRVAGSVQSTQTASE